MSFQDEMQANLKTPQQVEAEKEAADIAEAKKHAQIDFEHIKDALKEQVSKGNYIDFGDYKLVTAEVSSMLGKYCSKSVDIYKVRQGIGERLHRKCIVKYYDEFSAKEYLKELEKLTKRENIAYFPIAKFQWLDTVPTYFSIPGVCTMNGTAGNSSHLSVLSRVGLKLYNNPEDGNLKKSEEERKDIFSMISHDLNGISVEEYEAQQSEKQRKSNKMSKAMTIWFVSLFLSVLIIPNVIPSALVCLVVLVGFILWLIYLILKYCT